VSRTLVRGDLQIPVISTFSDEINLDMIKVSSKLTNFIIRKYTVYARKVTPKDFDY